MGRFEVETICPAVNTPIAKPMINVPNNRAAFGKVIVKNSSFVSTACVFCKTTITANKAMTAIAMNFSLFIEFQPLATCVLIMPIKCAR